MLTNAQRLGIYAGKMDQSIESNPYIKGSENYGDWLEGWWHCFNSQHWTPEQDEERFLI